MVQKVKNWNQISLRQGAIDRGWARVWPRSSELHKPSQLCAQGLVPIEAQEMEGFGSCAALA